MQRKNSFLKEMRHRRKSRGFAMIMAIIVIVIISTIMALSLSLTAQTTKRTSDLYLYEQAELLAKSVVERALLEIANVGCIDSYTTQTDLFNINVSMQYIFTEPSSCSDYFSINTLEQNGSVLMDTTISVRADQNITSEPIRYFRRSMQKL